MTIGRDDHGFTLVELVVATAMLGIVASVVVIAFGGATADMKLAAAAQEVQAMLRYAQSQSVVAGVQSGEEYGVGFSVSGNWFRGIKKNGTPTPDIVVHPVDKKSSVDFDDPGYFQGVALTTISFDADDRIFFDRRGTPSMSGSVAIQYGDETRTITVSWPVGAITVN